MNVQCLKFQVTFRDVHAGNASVDERQLFAVRIMIFCDESAMTAYMKI